MDSRVVAHPSTNTAWRSLTSLFGWEAVLSAQCGRIQQLPHARPVRPPPNSDCHGLKRRHLRGGSSWKAQEPGPNSNCGRMTTSVCHRGAPATS